MDAVHPASGPIAIVRVDGNAVAGRLSEIFRKDMTLASGQCRTCRRETEIASTVVELDDAGLIVLCPSCKHTMFTVVTGPVRTWIDLSGISGLSIPHA